MNKHLHNSLRVLFLSLAVLLSLPMLAEEVEIDGISYELNAEAKQATVIGKSGAFYGEVVIPESVEHEGAAYSVTSIGKYAFIVCSGLTSVTIGNSVESIGSYAFSGCNGLSSVTIGNSVTSIGDSAFYECSGLTSVTIPNSVTSIGDYTFYGCSGLTSVAIGNSVTSIGQSAFDECSGLISVHVSDIAAWCNIDFHAFDSNPLSYAYHLYLNGEEVKDLVIPNSVTSIGDYAFWGCSGLTSVTIPNSVTSIGYMAFYSCSGLTSVTIGNSVTSIGGVAFDGCKGLTSVHISDIAAWCNIDFDGYNSNPLTYAHHLYLNGEEVKDLVIPNSVTSIGSSAFRGCSGLTSVTIPNSVTSIGDYAFSRCSGLTSVTIPNSVTSIGDGAFSGCSGLTSIVVEEGNPVYDSRNNCNAIVETASNSLICGCNTSIIPNSVTSIGDYAFLGCDGLTSVTIPNSVESIGYEAFAGCSGLTSVTIPNSVTSIGMFAFGGCSGLTSITIPNSVTSIGSSAFRSCSGLTSVTIPNSVRSIGYGAFRDCSELLDVYCYAEKVSSTESDAFYGSYPENATLHVPAASVDSYRATAPWSSFGKIVALTPEETGIDEQKGENGK